MSVLIKGMEMPASRGEYGLLLYVDSDGTATVEGSYFRFEGEPFEAVPVPPHGRLIDADVLFDFILNIYKKAQGEARKAYSDVLDTIVAAGDVIPAEEGE